MLRALLRGARSSSSNSTFSNSSIGSSNATEFGVPFSILEVDIVLHDDVFSAVMCVCQACVVLTSSVAVLVIHACSFIAMHSIIMIIVVTVFLVAM